MYRKKCFFFFSSGPRLGSLTPSRNENGQYYARRLIAPRIVVEVRCGTNYYFTVSGDYSDASDGRNTIDSPI